jgi:hypothetical protein
MTVMSEANERHNKKIIPLNKVKMVKILGRGDGHSHREA